MAGCQRLWDGATYFDGGLNLAKTVRQPETCITAMLVLLARSFGLDDPRVDHAVQWLLTQQLADGGWNCETVRCGSRYGSFHTTISAVDAMHGYGTTSGEIPVSDAARVLLRSPALPLPPLLVRSSTPRSRDFLSRRNGTSTSCAASSTFGPPVPVRTPVSLTPSTSSAEHNEVMGRGHASAATPAARGSVSKNPARADGPPCAHCACFAGGTSRPTPESTPRQRLEPWTVLSASVAIVPAFEGVMDRADRARLPVGVGTLGPGAPVPGGRH